MKQSSRAWFLIIAACVVFHLPLWSTTAILIGYAIAEYVDHWQTKKTKELIVDDVLSGWQTCKDDSDSEEKGVVTRVRLTGKEQILAARIAELLVRIG